MADPSAKQQVLQALARSPEGATLEDVMGRLYFLEKFARGRADVRDARTVSRDDVQQRLGLR